MRGLWHRRRKQERTSRPGAANVFRRTGTNSWDVGTKLLGFGNSVAISGDYAIVGASRADPGGLLSAGAAYIFRRTGTNTWDAGTKVMAFDAKAGDQFGFGVAISGDYAVVGANEGGDVGGTGMGFAYIFRRTGANTWDGGTKITAFDAEAGDLFGRSLAISGDYLIVGAFGEDSGATDAGAAYVFRRTGGNTWESVTKITASDPQTSAFFGRQLAISGNDVIVGAFGADSEAGAAYIFE